MEFKYFIGIDISKLTVDITVLDDQGKQCAYKQLANNISGYRKMLKWLHSVGGIASSSQWLFCLEHTGVYSLPICCYLEEHQLLYSIQPGMEIKRSMGIQRGKNDQADSRVIARYAFMHRSDITLSKMPSKTLLRIKDLLSYRERLVKNKVRLKVAAKELKYGQDASLEQWIIEDTQQQVHVIEQSIKALEKKITELIEHDNRLHELYLLVVSVKGIGFLTAVNLLVYTHGFTRFKNSRQFACYCGLAPFEYRSGSSIKGKTKISYLGNKKLKAIIGNGVSSAIQHDQELKLYYARKLKEGKHKMSVKNAIKNKLLARVFAVVNRGTPFVEILKQAA